MNLWLVLYVDCPSRFDSFLVLDLELEDGVGLEVKRSREHETDCAHPDGRGRGRDTNLLLEVLLLVTAERLDSIVELSEDIPSLSRYRISRAQIKVMVQLG